MTTNHTPTPDYNIWHVGNEFVLYRANGFYAPVASEEVGRYATMEAAQLAASAA